MFTCFREISCFFFAIKYCSELLCIHVYVYFSTMYEIVLVIKIMNLLLQPTADWKACACVCHNIQFLISTNSNSKNEQFATHIRGQTDPKKALTHPAWDLGNNNEGIIDENRRREETVAFPVKNNFHHNEYSSSSSTAPDLPPQLRRS